MPERSEIAIVICSTQVEKKNAILKLIDLLIVHEKKKTLQISEIAIQSSVHSRFKGSIF